MPELFGRKIVYLPENRGVEGVPDVFTVESMLIQVRDFDYFDSKTKAEAHADREGIARVELEYGVGYKGKYTKIPRKYPEQMYVTLEDVHEDVNSNTDTWFAYSADHMVALGEVALSQDIFGESAGRFGMLPREGEVNPVPVYSLKTEFLGVQYFVPRTNAPRTEIKTFGGKDFHVVLGRSVATIFNHRQMLDTAVYDSYRPLETALVVGSYNYIGDYIARLADYESENRGLERSQRAEAFRGIKNLTY